MPSTMSSAQDTIAHHLNFAYDVLVEEREKINRKLKALETALDLNAVTAPLDDENLAAAFAYAGLDDEDDDTIVFSNRVNGGLVAAIRAALTGHQRTAKVITEVCREQFPKLHISTVRALLYSYTKKGEFRRSGPSGKYRWTLAPRKIKVAKG